MSRPQILDDLKALWLNDRIPAFRVCVVIAAIGTLVLAFS